MTIEGDGAFYLAFDDQVFFTADVAFILTVTPIMAVVLTVVEFEGTELRASGPRLVSLSGVAGASRCSTGVSAFAFAALAREPLWRINMEIPVL